MLTPEELLKIADSMYPLIDELNAWITRDMIRRLMARMDRKEEIFLTGTDTWQAEVYQSAGGHLGDLQNKISEFTKLSDLEVKSIFEDAGIRTYAYDEVFYNNAGIKIPPLLQSESMVRILTDSYQRTNGEIHNFTRTTAQASQKRLINILDETHLKVITGAQSYSAAVREAVNKIAEDQPAVIYGKRVDTIETAVLRAVRTGTAQASGNMAMQNMIERDWDIILVSAHLGARYGDGGENSGNHYWWQGKFYSRTGKTADFPLFSVTGYGTGEGLSGWNCRHSFGPGDGKHNPFQNYDEEKNKKAADLNKKQRQAENAIRHSKTKLIGLHKAIDLATDDETKALLQADYDKAALKLSKQNQFYTDFCESNGLKKLSDRITVAKWNRSDAAKAARVAKNQEKNYDYIKNDVIIKTSSGLPKKLKDLPDEVLQHTININIDKSVKLPNGFHAVAPKGTSLTNIEVMAGYGTSTPIRDLQRLYATYNLSPQQWQKKSGTVFGNNNYYVIHWYEHNGYIPAGEIKLKGMKENK